MTIVHMCLFPVMLRTHVFIPSDALCHQLTNATLLTVMLPPIGTCIC